LRAGIGDGDGGGADLATYADGVAADSGAEEFQRELVGGQPEIDGNSGADAGGGTLRQVGEAAGTVGMQREDDSGRDALSGAVGGIESWRN
jgi:hypothetical protein